MIRFTLECTGEGDEPGRWYFEEAKDGLDVFDANEEHVCWFAHAEANDRFTLPSFWRSVKNIGFRTDEGTTVWFYPDRKRLARLKSYLDHAIALQGEEAVDRLRLRAWLLLLAGVGMVVVGFVGIIGIGLLLDKPRRGIFYPFAALVLLGLGQAAWGVSSVFRAARLRRMWKRDEQEVDVEDQRSS